ncbi:LOW QUALITY PROTEIN: armadillo repeat-containing protein 7 [Anopheles stephensi]|uniref:LOW QUALITY PROTEIN: armadillo repeat-containing protein 7 n=1 Tax=Anopheles stephensi TaxID=30069 RepID=UPI001658B1B0|nr:LOW QUALITY PROTEIN: armadillo repeat-containing protein 7 [Anopheles stephensi]
MFSTQERLKRRTPNGGINRKTYLCLLVDEYYETSNIEAQQQVTANLANFAYDPINWKFLRDAKAHELFYEIIQQSLQGVVDRLLVLHSIVGLTNLSLDPVIAEYIERSNGLGQLRAVLEKYQTDCEIVCNTLTCCSFLLNDSRTLLFKQDKCLLSLLQHLKRSGNRRIVNLATILAEDLSRAMRWLQLARRFSNAATKAQPTVGTVFSLTKTFRQTDVQQFVALTGDSNPIHVTDAPDLKEQIFVNGAFLNGVIAGIIGTNFPGFVVTTQNFRFPNRCHLEKEVQFSVKVEEMRKIVTVSYESKQNGIIVFEGQAKLFAVRK